MSTEINNQAESAVPSPALLDVALERERCLLLELQCMQLFKWMYSRKEHRAVKRELRQASATREALEQCLPTSNKQICES